MPLIRCPKCGQAYDVPGAVAVRLPNSIATCHCGEWLAGSKAAVLARMLKPDDIKEIDLSPYRVTPASASPFEEISEPEPQASEPVVPTSIRVIARGAKDAVNTVFTIAEHPLWIGRKGCHVELEEAELDIRHCSISARGRQLVVRDADSHMGTYLDGQQITEAVVGEGVHLLRAGSALLSIEMTEEKGLAVEPIALADKDVFDDSVLRAIESRKKKEAGGRPILVCIDGQLKGQEFEIPATGLIVGREGHVRVPDEFLSRKHFEVIPDADGSVRVRDLGSRNGTFLNTLPARNTKVQAGDEIRAGVNRFRIEQRA
jgi:pSer/pThr/pTyr-binding forkhead associated (FHA) protein